MHGCQGSAMHAGTTDARVPSQPTQMLLQRSLICIPFAPRALLSIMEGPYVCWGYSGPGNLLLLRSGLSRCAAALTGSVSTSGAHAASALAAASTNCGISTIFTHCTAFGSPSCSFAVSSWRYWMDPKSPDVAFAACSAEVRGRGAAQEAALQHMIGVGW